MQRTNYLQSILIKTSSVKTHETMSSRKIITAGISSWFDSKARLFQAHQHKLLSKDMRTQTERNSYYPHQHQHLKLDWMGRHMELLSWLIATMHQHQMTWFCFLKQIQVNSMLMRSNAPGSNREMKDASITDICWSLYPHRRFRLKSSGLNNSDRRIENAIYSPRRIYSGKNFRIFKRIISGAAKRFRDNSRFIDDIYYRHEAGVGR